MVAVARTSGGADSANTGTDRGEPHQQESGSHSQNNESGISIKRSSLSGSTSGATPQGDGSFGNLDALDDLGSLDSDVAMSTESSARHHPTGGGGGRQQQQPHNSHPNSGGSSSSNQGLHYNPIGLTIGEALSPSVYLRQTGIPQRGYTSPRSSISLPQQRPPAVNAVHMHVQENSKVPTLNITVDRSNSSRPAYGRDISNATKQDLEEMFQLEANNNSNNNRSRSRSSDNDINNSRIGGGGGGDRNRGNSGNLSMAELFLSKESSQRRSLDLNYDHLGAVLMDFGFGGGGSGAGDRVRRYSIASNSVSSVRSAGQNSIKTANDDTQMEIDALTAAIDPTPLSEIREKIMQRTDHANESNTNNNNNNDTNNDKGKGQGGGGGDRSKNTTSAGSSSSSSTKNNTNHTTVIDTTIATHHPHRYNYYPYGRQYQLPIPQKISSQPRSPMSSPAVGAPMVDGAVADAIATAAAIASTGGFPGTSSATASLPPPPSRQASTNSNSNSSSGRGSSSTTTTQHHHNHPARHPSPIVSNTTLPYTKAQQTSSTSTTPTSRMETTPNSSSLPSTMNSSNISSTAPPSSAGTARHFQRHQGPSYNPQHHADAHSTSRASVVAAAHGRSQYGFGGNHMVPSVPGPQPSMGNKHHSQHPSHHHTTASPPPHHSHMHGTTHLNNGVSHMNNALPSSALSSGSTSTSPIPPAYAGAAYERKKQRAKDARVKLNDAIERLAISMNLAGSQSKERADLLMSKSSSSATNRNSLRSKTLHRLEECTREAESAKKWDRPDFVGTAANLIHALNSQCEGLLNELIALEEEFEHVTTGGMKSAGTKPLSEKGTVSPAEVRVEDKGNCENGNIATNMATTSHPDHKRHDAPSSNQGDHEVDEELTHTTKRIKGIQMDDAARGVVIGDAASSSQSTGITAQHPIPQPLHMLGGNTTEEQTVLGLVSKLLDPSSLCRCPSVSRSWRGTGAFHKDQTWMDLAVKRYGYYNVRQWTEKLQDSDQAGGGEIQMKSLYRAMNNANVMPHIQQEGMLLLGEAKIPGRVSGWAFMVERSNGETLRSVKRETTSVGSTGGPAGGTTSSWASGTYVSLPVVELRIIIQNIGMANGPAVLKDQNMSVDTSTRRSGGELKEIHWDDRFTKEVVNLDGSARPRRPPSSRQSSFEIQRELCRLDLFEAVMLKVHIHARGCTTMSRFQQRSNFTKVLVCLDGTTVPLVIPFLRDANNSQM